MFYKHSSHRSAKHFGDMILCHGIRVYFQFLSDLFDGYRRRLAAGIVFALLLCK